tara:strand:+ start:295 stop:483 length:189 start_codon:yes stop_codon:yes gene_type:complete
MKSFLEILLISAMVITAIVLMIGIFNLFKTNKTSTSHRLMSIRVVCQAVALGILAVLFLMKK